MQPVVDAELSLAGFAGRRNSWRRKSREIISVVQLQKDPYGNYGYLNVGFWICSLGANPAPLERECHIRLRACDLFNNLRDRIDVFMDLERVSMSDAERINGIHRAMRVTVIPFLDSAQNLEGLTKNLSRVEGPSLMIRKEAGPVLGK